MKLGTQLAVTKLSSGLTRTEQAQECCRLAGQLERAGEYEAAYEALSDFWPDRHNPPIVGDFDQETKGEVLLRVGALAGWLGSALGTESQDQAKNLLTQSIEIFEQLGRADKVSEAQSDLALCYWREGGFDEARDIFDQTLRSLKDESSDLRATVLIRAGIVEENAGRFTEALRLYKESVPLVDQSPEHALKGSLHLNLGTVYTRLAEAEEREDCLDLALIEYAAASIHFEQAGHLRQYGSVENNLGFLFATIGKFDEAHRRIDRARDVFVALGDRGHTAQVNDTRARAFLAEGRVREAERYARAAVRTLDRGDECSLLVEALTTHGIALARLGRYPGARSELQRAINVAETCGDLEGAGRARLSIIEELSGQTSAIEMASIHKSAVDLLQRSQDPSAAKRLISSARIVIDSLLAAEAEGAGLKAQSWEGFSLKRELRAFENTLIERALRDAGGAVTKASRMLGFHHHQSLISLIASRHKDLLNTRSAIRKRRRHLVSHPKRAKRKAAPQPAEKSQISILQVEDNKAVTMLIQDALAAEGMRVDSCSTGTAALEILKGDIHYDIVIVDSEVPGLSGLDLVVRVRSMAHRRNLRIIMLSGDEIEREAWRAGAHAFLRKPEAIDQVSSTITRLLEERRAKGLGDGP